MERRYKEYIKHNGLIHKSTDKIMEVYITVVNAGELTFDRPYIESLEGMKFKSTDAFYEELKKIDNNAKEKVHIFPLFEFTQNWNDTDDEDKYLSIEDTFIGYIYIGE